MVHILLDLIPIGTLAEEHFNLQLFAHHGLPRTTSISVFDHIQRLFVVAYASRFFGVAGVEVRHHQIHLVNLTKEKNYSTL